jgi:predicted nucleic acid-binding protein
MISFVLDASALVELAIGASPDRDLIRRARTGSGAAPELIDVEALKVLRRLVGDGVDQDIVTRAVRDVHDAPISRMAHRPLMPRVWQLRLALSAYDATYVALAERLVVPLLTCDAKLGRAHGHGAEVIVYPTS